MSTPAWILEIFAAVMLLAAEVSAGQLVAQAWTRRGGTDADIAVSHLLMGIAMAGPLYRGAPAAFRRRGEGMPGGTRRHHGLGRISDLGFM
jgi:hypothetical protein